MRWVATLPGIIANLHRVQRRTLNSGSSRKKSILKRDEGSFTIGVATPTRRVGRILERDYKTVLRLKLPEEP
jgi:hypothetical protein